MWETKHLPLHITCFLLSVCPPIWTTQQFILTVHSFKAKLALLLSVKAKSFHCFNSVYTGELCAIYQAVLLICWQTRQCHLCTDSLKCLSVSLAMHLKIDHWDFESSVYLAKQAYPVNNSADAVAELATIHGSLSSNTVIGGDVCASFHPAIVSLWHCKWASTQGIHVDVRFLLAFHQ